MMGNEKRLIDANAFRGFWNKNYRHQYANDKFLVAIANFPTVDALEVVNAGNAPFRTTSIQDARNLMGWLQLRIFTAHTEKGEPMAEYIEREAAIKMMRGSAIAKYPLSFYLGILAAADELQKMPASDVAPVVHGRWIAVDEYMTDECSNCGARINIEEFDDCSYHPKYGNVRSDYCPNCGAKMDLEEQNDQADI